MPPTDTYQGYDNITSSARDVFLIVPSDTVELPLAPKAIRCDVAGTITFRAVDDATFVTMTMAAGEILPVRAAHVKATGTTATLHGLA